MRKEADLMATAVDAASVAVRSFGGLALVKKDGTVSKPFPLVERRYLFGRCVVMLRSISTGW